MLTRTHYESVARIARRCRIADESDSGTTWQTARLMDELADYFAEDNPRFDRERFEAAWDHLHD